MVLALLAGCVDNGPGSQNWVSFELLGATIIGAPVAAAALVLAILLQRRSPALAAALALVVASGFFAWGAKTAWEGRVRMARMYYGDPAMRTSADEEDGRRGYANVRAVVAVWGFCGVGLAALGAGFAQAARRRSAPVVMVSGALAATGLGWSLVVLIATIPPARSALPPPDQRVFDESIFVLRAHDREQKLLNENTKGLDWALLFHDSHCSDLMEAIGDTHERAEYRADKPVDVSRLLKLSPNFSRAVCLCRAVADEDLFRRLTNAGLHCNP
jgi:hypothetical protein